MKIFQADNLDPKLKVIQMDPEQMQELMEMKSRFLFDFPVKFNYIDLNFPSQKVYNYHQQLYVELLLTNARLITLHKEVNAIKDAIKITEVHRGFVENRFMITPLTETMMNDMRSLSETERIKQGLNLAIEDLELEIDITEREIKETCEKALLAFSKDKQSEIFSGDKPNVDKMLRALKELF